MGNLEERLREELRFRELAFSWLHDKTEAGTHPITWQELGEFKGHVPEARHHLIMFQGIWKPGEFLGALGVTSGAPDGKKERNVYEDVLTEEGYVEYEFTRNPEKHNDALRAAYKYSLPMIYFRALRTSLYDAYFPVWIIHVDEARRRVLLDITGASAAVGEHDLLFTERSSVLEVEPGYGKQIVRTRLHQRDFRANVMYSYRSQCSVCSLRHSRLLDAAHIVPDRDGGSPHVDNGLSLCKIHHSAFDANILGVDPSYRVHIRNDILEEVDGPMLKHGLQDHHGQQLRVVPEKKSERPKKERLEERFSQFKEA